MKLQLKNSLILTGTLLLGIIIGVLLSGRIMHSRVEHMKNFYTERGFNRQIMRAIKPTDKQMEQLRPVFRDQAKKNQSLFENCQKKHRELLEGFRTQLEQYLTDEQLHRLDEMELRMRRGAPNALPPPAAGNRQHQGPYNRRHQRN